MRWKEKVAKIWELPATGCQKGGQYSRSVWKFEAVFICLQGAMSKELVDHLAAVKSIQVTLPDEPEGRCSNSLQVDNENSLELIELSSINKVSLV